MAKNHLVLVVVATSFLVSCKSLSAPTTPSSIGQSSVVTSSTAVISSSQTQVSSIGIISSPGLSSFSVKNSSSVTASSSSVSSSSSGSGSPLGTLITQTMWNTMFPNTSYSACQATSKTVYTYQNFLAAAAAYPSFAQSGTDSVRKREIAAFLANASHETTGGWSTAPGGPYKWGFCYVEEVGYYPNLSDGGAYTQADATYPPVAGQYYHGRGALQLSWNYNYGQASQAIYGDKNVLLNFPDSVALSGVLAFKTAMWFWMTAQSPKPSAHDVMVSNATDNPSLRPAGFGLTINIINGGIECGQPGNAQVADRVGFYTTYLGVFGLPTTEANMDCGTQTAY